ncbi:MAG TPA: SDR family oxidoreductase [Acidimicrobiales bacterium]|nr:SDR family oxidoreductase [Acidimicrobiales bacterium]
MDLGVAGRRAIVCASSQGLGRACARALAAEGVDVVVNGRDPEEVDKAVAEIAASGTGQVIGVAADLTEPRGRDALLAACPEPDILVLNNRGPKPGLLGEVTDDDFEVALDLHYRAPIALVRAVLPGMRARKWGRIVAITSAMVTSPNEGMITSVGARAGLTGVLKSLSFAAAADGVTINQLLPERFATQRQIDNANRTVERDGVTFEQAWAAQAATIAAKRHGDPTELGAMCAFLCSEHAGFVSGMNVHLDGGSYRGIV